MSSKFKARDVPKAQYSNYFKRGEECLVSSRLACERGEWNASAINAIHAVISLADTMCVYFLGKRSSSEDHNDSAKLFKSVNAECLTEFVRKRIGSIR